MPILRLNNIPYYIAISDFVTLPVLKKLIMYKDKHVRNQPFDEFDKKVLKEFVQYNGGHGLMNKFQYINLENTDARCAVTELILYHVYFFCRNTRIYGNKKTRINVLTSQISLNDILFPYRSWKIEYMVDLIFLNSGDSYFTLELSNIEKISGYFNRFKVVLKDVVIIFMNGEISYEIRNDSTVINIEEIADEDEQEINPAWRLLNSKDRRNYRDFVFYLNDRFLYSDYGHPKFYANFTEYREQNANILRS